LNARASSTWGRIWWRSNGNVVLQPEAKHRETDETWSDWSPVYADQKGAQISSPKAQFLQWRSIF
jgi:hypothetical protein